MLQRHLCRACQRDKCACQQKRHLCRACQREARPPSARGTGPGLPINAARPLLRRQERCGGRKRRQFCTSKSYLRILFALKGLIWEPKPEHTGTRAHSGPRRVCVRRTEGEEPFATLRNARTRKSNARKVCSSSCKTGSFWICPTLSASWLEKNETSNPPAQSLSSRSIERVQVTVRSFRWGLRSRKRRYL